MKIAVKDIIYVLLQILLVYVFLLDGDLFYFEIPSYLEVISILTGSIGLCVLVVAIFQLHKNLTPFPTPKQTSRLLTGGIFKIVRHPIYTGMLIVVFSIAVFQGSGYKLLISFLLLILFHFKILYEEKRLTEKFPDYKIYKKNTGKFIPRIKKNPENF